MRPLKGDEGEDALIVQKISSNSVSVLDRTFTYDSVADTRSTQESIFQLVGLPLIENCLAGFNSSIFAYGQTGSGKTYTMWGPLAILSNDGTSNSERGLTPRVFERLFARINEEQLKHSKKQLSYQCRCSFLEIYNEQITDLLDPIRGNLQIRENVKSKAVIYVENLTEAFVFSTRDVIQLLTKGLEYRRTGATSLNAESSRSHCVFTCVVESRSKCMPDGLNSLRTSRINLVDLAGSERQKQTGAAGDGLKEAGNINRSLSQLGNLINILAEITKSGKQRHIPYRDSKLTFLLQESLGGNAKLAMICAVSPSLSCKSETFSTLRFAQRAKAVKNKAVVNEVTQDEREQIRQEELYFPVLGSTSNRRFASNTLVTTEHLAKSFNHGLEIFDLHQQKLSMRPSFKFSPKHVHVKESVPAMKVDRGIQTLAENLRLELEASHALAEKQKVELDSERKCLEEALKTAIEGQVRILEQYADLQEKHVQILAQHRTLRDGISDVKY